MESVFQGQVCQ
uniref:Uncharacterized protein n=1 Tax=Anguilla anguilla TaxID=7936 RepID=A0A0E9PUK1_ANGAN